MAKIYFKHGTMGSGKSLDLIRAVYNYTERGMKPLVFKPSLDTREGNDFCVIKSRTGAEVLANWIDSDDDDLSTIIFELNDRLYTTYYLNDSRLNMENNKLMVDAIFIDEAQFLTEKQVDKLPEIRYSYNIPILCYGLKLDFQSHLFPGAKRLIELADDVQELIGICHCGKRAKQNARIIDGKFAEQGDLVQIGGNESYIALCNECYYKKDLGGKYNGKFSK